MGCAKGSMHGSLGCGKRWKKTHLSRPQWTGCGDKIVAWREIGEWLSRRLEPAAHKMLGKESKIGHGRGAYTTGPWFNLQIYALLTGLIR